MRPHGRERSESATQQMIWDQRMTECGRRVSSTAADALVFLSLENQASSVVQIQRGRVIVSTPTPPSCGARPARCVLSQEGRSALRYTLWLSLNQLFGAPAPEKTALGSGDVTDSKTQSIWRWVDGSGGGSGGDAGGGGTKGRILGPHTVVVYVQSSWQTLQPHSCFQGLRRLSCLLGR